MPQPTNGYLDDSIDRDIIQAIVGAFVRNENPNDLIGRPGGCYWFQVKRTAAW
jgi:hypothetical protein